jgi:hypothetical protein
MRKTNKKRPAKNDSSPYDLPVDLNEVANLAEELTEKTTSDLNNLAEPFRKSAFKRFPTLFSMLVAFGATSTFFGMEQILIKYQLLENYPWLIFGIGVTILIITGKLYQKLK